jgi:Replication protein
VRYQFAMENLPRILKENPGLRFGMWTLTVRNCSAAELPGTVSLMNAAFRRMTLRETSPVLGYVRSLEITFPREGEAHPHYHVLVARDRFGKFPSHAELVRIWRECCRVDYDPVVECHMVKGPDLVKAVGQVLKYSIKPLSELAYATWAIPAVALLKNVKFVTSGGVFKGIFDEVERPEMSPVKKTRSYAYRAVEREYRRELGDV